MCIHVILENLFINNMYNPGLNVYSGDTMRTCIGIGWNKCTFKLSLR